MGSVENLSDRCMGGLAADNSALELHLLSGSAECPWLDPQDTMAPSEREWRRQKALEIGALTIREDLTGIELRQRRSEV